MGDARVHRSARKVRKLPGGEQESAPVFDPSVRQSRGLRAGEPRPFRHTRRGGLHSPRLSAGGELARHRPATSPRTRFRAFCRPQGQDSNDRSGGGATELFRRSSRRRRGARCRSIAKAGRTNCPSTSSCAPTWFPTGTPNFAGQQGRTLRSEGPRQWVPHDTEECVMSDGTSLSLVLDQVSKDKNIERKVLVEALEQAILTAAKKAFGEDREMEASFNEATGRVDLSQIIIVADPVTAAGEGNLAGGSEPLQPAGRRRRRAALPDFLRRQGSGQGRGAGRQVRRPAQSQPGVEDLWTLRGPDREAGHPAAGARGRARERFQPVPRQEGRADLGHRAPFRAWQHRRRSGWSRGDFAGARTGTTRILPGWRPHRGVRGRHRQVGARTANHHFARAQGPAREALRDGGARDLRQDRARRGLGARGRGAFEDRGVFARSRRGSRWAPAWA